MRTALVTTRLRLDACTPSDAAELHVLFSDPLTNTIGSGPFTALDQTERWIRRRDERLGRPESPTNTDRAHPFAARAPRTGPPADRVAPTFTLRHVP